MSLDQAHGLRRLLAHRSSGTPPGGRRGRALAVMSGKGGVGKTQVAVGLALLAARRGRRVLVIDGDVGMANADVVLGVRADHTIEDVLAGTCAPTDAVVRGAEGVSLLAAGSGPSLLARLGAKGRQALRCTIEELVAASDITVIDCGAGIGDTVLFLAGLADERLIVVTPEPTALVDGYAMAKAIAGDGHRSADVVVNCALTHTEAECCFSKLEAVACRFLPIELRFAGGIPRDDAVRRAVMGRRHVVVDAPAARVSQALARLEGRLALGARREQIHAVSP